jgi:hypothetical protein
VCTDAAIFDINPRLNLIGKAYGVRSKEGFDIR